MPESATLSGIRTGKCPRATLEVEESEAEATLSHQSS